MNAALYTAIIIAITVALAIPMAHLIAQVCAGKQPRLLAVVAGPVERGIYRLVRTDPSEEMSWKRYLASVLAFSLAGVVALMAILMLQGFLPANPSHLPGLGFDLAFNTAISFVTNTNWQSYIAETTLSRFSQVAGLCVWNFASAATGIGVMFALIRAFRREGVAGLGSFWADLVRIMLYILMPLNLVVALALAAGGVVENFGPDRYADLLEPVAALSDGQGGYTVLERASIQGDRVELDGKPVPQAVIISRELLAQGPAASQVAIKQTGTNGGGYFGANAAHPYENPNAFTNLVETVSILLVPMACTLAFGIGVKNSKQGRAFFAAMLILLICALGTVCVSEQAATPALSASNQVNSMASELAAGGNMEGKEARFGIAASSVWTVSTTAASSGSVNASHDSLTPVAALVAMVQMALGEVIFGGVGSGLYGMVGFAILTVFIAGLMVGRTPEFLGKKIEPEQMRWAVVLCLASPFVILAGSSIAALMPSVTSWLSTQGAHGFSEFLYAFMSTGANNGSAFGGISPDPWLNICLGLVMFGARFMPIGAALALAGSLARHSRVATSAGTLSTTNALFVFLLILIIILIGALSFYPVFALGPVAEQIQMIFG
ncbi:potassium-transporting ATPase subunit KdpA [Collinsella sp. AGMB00827]|uniref:Potassium-transporting ATPase potassium-binding subunit n=1 Tax=Collinsella ureilytica TaxID=2869515 RepID=A0ABS7MLF2_9ACTN|nr:potassium-transporting ATPase subunit KdpA [Collinsella urealyticum]MBY4798133.1 potassium-transporting ATPase subunit KdpA [Collinsella urealyticum]